MQAMASLVRTGRSANGLPMCPPPLTKDESRVGADINRAVAVSGKIRGLDQPGCDTRAK